MREARGETEAALKEMIMAINSQYYLTRDEDLAEIIKICNVDIKRIKTQILRRKKKLSTEPEVPETSAAVPSAGQVIKQSATTSDETSSRHVANGGNWPPLIYDPLTGVSTQEEFYLPGENRSFSIEQEERIRSHP